MDCRRHSFVVYSVQAAVFIGLPEVALIIFVTALVVLSIVLRARKKK
ncbi:MAG: hypothetical protein JW828_03445 [Sedimentisphaerales bacterium]|nr:hypothetical protein [Sedimentisphaerales bacterium]